MSTPRTVDLQIEGMTCASCAARIEKKLNRLEGVSASVNYATEKAHVALSGTLTTDDVLDTVEALGYHALPPDAVLPGDATESEGAAGLDPAQALWQRLMICVALTVPVVAMAMVPRLQFDDWQWLSLTLAAPVAVWGAWPFHRAAWVNARHGTTTMDTLISIGVIASFGWSLYALFFGTAGMPGMHMTFALLGSNDAANEIYLEVAAGVTCFILAGRYFEASAKRRSGAALRALLDLGAKQATVLRDGREVQVGADTVVVGDRFVVRPGEKIATDGMVVEGESAVDASLVTGESMPVEVGVGDVVFGASINAGGRLVVEATRVGADTQLAQIARLVEQAQQGKAPVQRSPTGSLPSSSPSSSSWLRSPSSAGCSPVRAPPRPSARL
jgi:Cu+-exporting ATPase